MSRRLCAGVGWGVVVVWLLAQGVCSGAGLSVRGFNLEGEVSPEHEDCLRRELAAEIGRTLDTTTLDHLRRRLTRRCYLDRGYVNSGVLLPDQTVADGRVSLRVVEGGLSAVTVAGNTALGEEFFQTRATAGLARPLSLAQLRQRILLLERHPLIDTIDARLMPGERPGESRLHLQVHERSPWELALAVDNYRRSPSVGAEHFSLDVRRLSPGGRGDLLDLRLGATRGSTDARLAYDLPLGAADALLFHAEYSDSVVVETPFERLDIAGDYVTVGVGWRRDWLDTLDDQVSVSLGLAHKRSASRLFGEAFSFSPGVSDGQSRLALLTFDQQWRHRRVVERRVAAAWLLHSRITLGIDALGATVHDALPDGRFVTWLGQGRFHQRLDRRGRYRLTLRGRAQLADSALLPLEKFALGGVDTVRGFRENRLVRDNGLAASLELHVSLVRSGGSWGALDLVSFIDYGTAWNRDAALRLGETLAGAGVGLVWSSPGGLAAELFAALPLQGPDDEGDDLQDRGLHFQIRYRVL